MNMRRTTLLKSLLLLLTVTGCTPATIPVRQQTETEFTLGYETCYGDYYQPEGIGRNVVMLDIFGRRLDQDSIGRLVGTGTNFGFTDVFLPEGAATLEQAEGTYTADTTGAAFTFLPGTDYDGLPFGAFLQNVTDGSRTELILFSGGEFTLMQDEDTTVIDCRLLYEEYGRTKTYEAHYRGVLNHLEWKR